MTGCCGRPSTGCCLAAVAVTRVTGGLHFEDVVSSTTRPIVNTWPCLKIVKLKHPKLSMQSLDPNSKRSSIAGCGRLRS